MKKRIYAFLMCFMISFNTYALSFDNFPESFSIKTNTQCPAGCFEVLSHNQKMGSMALGPNKGGTYYYRDEHEKIQVILKFIKVSWYTLFFDIFDHDQQLIAHLTLQPNPKSGQIQAFALYTADNKTILLSGGSLLNLFGTHHSIFDTAMNLWSDPIAELYRPLFTWSRDSKIEIRNKYKLQKVIDLNPHLLPSILSLYCLSEVRVKVDHKDANLLPLSNASKQMQPLIAQLDKLQTLSLPEDNALISEEQLQDAANILTQRYAEIHNDSDLSEQEKIKQFIDFSCGLIMSHTFTPLEEKAMIQFLKKRVTELYSTL